MPKTRVILELGSGNDLHAPTTPRPHCGAVQDALHHSSLSFIRSLKIDKTKLDVEGHDRCPAAGAGGPRSGQEILAGRQRQRAANQGWSRCCRS